MRKHKVPHSRNDLFVLLVHASILGKITKTVCRVMLRTSNIENVLWLPERFIIPISLSRLLQQAFTYHSNWVFLKSSDSSLKHIYECRHSNPFFSSKHPWSTVLLISYAIIFNTIVLLNTQCLNTHLIYLHKTSGVHTSSFLCAVFICSASLQTAWVFKNGILFKKQE